MDNNLEENNVCFIGAGYIGGSTAPIMALKNPHLTFTVVDVNQPRIYQWNSDSLPIYEPGLDDIVKQVRNKNLFFSTDIDSAIKNAKVIFIGVNTPTKTFGEGAGFASDLTYWESAAWMIAKSAVSDKIVVEKSTLPVKTADAIAKILNENSSHRFSIVSNPEFLAEGTAVRDLLNPDRVLIGGDEESVSEISKIYKAWVPAEKILTTNVWTSELAKLAANAMLAQRVSSINSFACVCEEVGANVHDLSRILGADSRIGNKFLVPGPGFGGSCFKKDILNFIYLCRTYGLNEVAEYWHNVIKMNEYQQKRIVLRLLKNSFNTLSNKKICVLGYSFKANSGDTRETPAKAIVEFLHEEHAHVTVYDPKSNANAKTEIGSIARVYDDPIQAIDGATAIVVATNWDEFKDYDWNTIFELMKGSKIVFDARNYLDHSLLQNIGFNVMTVGINYL